MLYEMKLREEPFNSIKNGLKKIEMRLYDEKRKNIKVGDEIRFTNLSNGEQLLTKVISLHIFASFEKLYEHFNKTELGYKPNETASFKDMEQYYSIDEQNKYGVVGIKLELM